MSMSHNCWLILPKRWIRTYKLESFEAAFDARLPPNLILCAPQGGSAPEERMSCS